MRFVEVDEIPERVQRKLYRKISPMLDDFMEASIKYARVETKHDDWSTCGVMYRDLRNAVKNRGYPIQVVQRNGDVYLARKDI